MRRLVRGSRRRVVAAISAVLAGSLLAAGCAADGSPDGEPTPTASSAPPGTQLTMSVYGPKSVTDTYRRLAEVWAGGMQGVELEVKTYGGRAQAMAALRQDRAAGDPPDLFLAGLDDLAGLATSGALRRVDDLLSARQVDFGDGYNRRGLEAFGRDAALQCMPVDVSPLVVYYNPQLVELGEIAEEGRRDISQQRGWTLEEFARGASQPQARGVRGLYVAPTLDQVAPFVWSGGGAIADDVAAPTTLTFSDDASAEAMEQLLTVVRDPALTFGPRALERKPALERFIDGQLGMMLGYRDLVATLRETPELTFDVMPMPVIDTGATSGRMSGLCLSADSPEDAQEAAADLLVDLISTESQNALAETGAVVPTNVESLGSESFLQSGERPLHSMVYAREMRDIEPQPASENWGSVSAVASRQLERLFTDPLIDPLEDRLAAIDAASVPLLVTSDEGDEEGDDEGEGPSQTPEPTEDATP